MSSNEPSPVSMPLNSPMLRRAGIGLGVLSIILGILVLVLPGATLVVIAILFGIELIVIGAARIALGAAAPAGSGWVKPVAIIIGVLTILAGIFCFVHPGASLVILAIFLGFGWIMDGIGTLAHTFGSKASGGRTLSVINGIATIVAGLVVVVFPGASLLLLVRVGGVALIILGVVQILTGVSRRT
jgi:uncharacterized membrane protein HdeD (DUF308 family)